MKWIFKSQKKMYKFIARNVFQIIGGMFLGLTTHGVLVSDKPMLDMVILGPLGVLLLGISYYYVFIEPRKNY